MKNFGIVVLCAGVFCTAAPKMIGAAVLSVTQAQIGDGTAVPALQAWITAHQADWDLQLRGNGVGTFGQYLEDFHESRESRRGCSTINRVLGRNDVGGKRCYSVGTQFGRGKAVNAVTAFFNSVSAGARVAITPDVGFRGDGSWHVKMDLPSPVDDYMVQDPYLFDNGAFGRKDGFSVRYLGDVNDAFNWVPAWAFRRFKSLQFKFVKKSGKDNKESGEDSFVLDAIFPVAAPGGLGSFLYEHIDGNNNDYYRIILGRDPLKEKKNNKGIPCQWPVPVSLDEFLENQKQIHEAMNGTGVYSERQKGREEEKELGQLVRAEA